ncbi:MAG: ATP-binding protein [Tolumonas sp.]|nr:ATP-binding protein [Tolumonas sp.]
MTDILKRFAQIQKSAAELAEKHTRKAFCEKHKAEYIEDNRTVSGNYEGECPLCKAERESVALAELANLRRIKRIKQSGLPPRFHDRTLDSYQITNPRQQSALDAVKSYCADLDGLRNGRSLLMIGNVGVGKTHLAAGVINALVKPDNKVDAVYTTARDMIRDIRSTWKNSDRDESEAIAYYADTSLLVIDEVGVQYGSESEAILMFDVIDKRYGSRLPTVFISNLKMAEVKTILTDRIIDRLREDNGLTVQLEWTSQRGAA